MHPSRIAERVKKLRIEPMGTNLVRFHSTLEDHSESPEGPEIIHSLSLEGTITVPDLMITSVQAKALVQPYKECAGSVHSLQKIVGMKIAAGFSSRVKAMLGGTAGCSHFLALVLDLAASHTLTMYLRMSEHARLQDSDDDDAKWTRVGLALEPRLENACIALATEARQMQRAKRDRNS